MKRPPLAGLDQKRTAWQQAIDAWYGCNRSPKYAAEHLGINHNTMQNRIKTAQAQGYQPQTQLGEYLRGETPEPQQAPKPRITVTAAMQSSANRSVLVISDLHAPYQHVDSLRFLTALKDKYQPDRIVCIGDELDFHAMSFHDSDPDLDSAGRELQRGREVLWELEAIFPRMDLLSSNHGDLLYRRAKAHGLPRHLVLEYGDAIFAEKLDGGALHRPRGRGEGWKWHKSLVIDLPNGRPCLFVHGMSKSTIRNVQQCGMCFIQGHHHGSFEIVYNGTPDALNWGATIGCLIDDHALAFAYNKSTLARPVIGCAAIIDGQPKLLPMILAKGGRWSGFVP